VTAAVVGVAQVTQRDGALDAVGLMAAAARLAAADAGAPELLGRVGEVLVPEGTWSPGDAGRAVVPGARTVLGRVGVLQTTLLARAAAGIAAGRVDVALVVGGEARARARALGLGDDVPPGPADVELAPDGEIVTALEIERGLAVPVQSYALQEPDPDELDELWERFRAVATANPHAWDATPRPAGDKLVSTP
jgi:acetyl-CoA C-acetyltransferase